MLFGDNLSEADAAYLASLIKILAVNFGKLGASRRLITVNPVLKLAITRDTRDLVIPPTSDLDSEVGGRPALRSSP